MKSVLWPLAISIFVLSVEAWAQPPDTLWSRVYRSSRMEQAAALDTAFDGGYVMCGTVYDSIGGPADAIIRKLDSLGNVQWAWRLAHSTVSEGAYDIIQASDSAFVWVGDYWSGPESGLYVVKCSGPGDSLWSRWIDMGAFTRAASVIEAHDGGYLIAGDASIHVPPSVTVIAKFSQTGDSSWMRFYSRGSQLRFDVRDMIALPDGGFAFVCQTFNPYRPLPRYLSLVRCDSAGDTLWTRDYEHPSGSLWPINMCATPDGGFLISGELEADHFYAYLLCVNSIGDTLWSKNSANGTMGVSAGRIGPASSTGYILCGSVLSVGGSEVSLLRLLPNGDVLWNHHVRLAEY